MTSLAEMDSASQAALLERVIDLVRARLSAGEMDSLVSETAMPHYIAAE